MDKPPASTAKDNKRPSIANTRQQVLDGVKQRINSTYGSGRLKGKVGVITGVGPEMGIGTAAAKLFAREGAAHLYLIDYNDKPLPALSKWLQSTYPNTKVTYLGGDASTSSVISKLIDQIIEEEGRLDFFFANAGISQLIPQTKTADEDERIITGLRALTRSVKDIAEEEFNEIMRINALGPFIAIKYASEAMGKISPDKGKSIPGGSIILTASVAGLKANAGPIPYSASKAAVISMAQTAAYDLTGQNVRVNAICPGLIETDMTRGMFALAEKMGKVDKMGVLNPALRQGLGSEVAHTALFLASDESSYVNGQAIPVDGGLSSGLPYTRMKL